jgi:hypothetical protein
MADLPPDITKLELGNELNPPLPVTIAMSSPDPLILLPLQPVSPNVNLQTYLRSFIQQALLQSSSQSYSIDELLQLLDQVLEAQKWLWKLQHPQEEFETHETH